jgi:hypothetical protein
LIKKNYLHRLMVKNIPFNGASVKKKIYKKC